MIDNVVYENLELDDALILLGRHRFAMCFLTSADGGWVILALGVGDLQGGRAAPGKFIQIFDPRVDEWVQQTSTPEEITAMHIVEPWTGLTIDVSYGTYADDLFRVGLPESWDTALAKIDAWDEGLERHLTDEPRLSQNKEKRVAVQSLWERRKKPNATILMNQTAPSRPSHSCCPQPGRLAPHRRPRACRAHDARGGRAHGLVGHGLVLVRQGDPVSSSP